MVEGGSAAVVKAEGMSEEEAVAEEDSEAVISVAVVPEEGVRAEVALAEAEKEEDLEEEEMAVVE